MFKYTMAILLASGVSFMLGSANIYIQNYESITRKPCIDNLHNLSHPWFAKFHQRGLEDEKVHLYDAGTDKERRMTGQEWHLEMVEYMRNSGMTMSVVRGESPVTDAMLYYVPQGCYATDLDSYNGPVLWRSE